MVTVWRYHAPRVSTATANPVGKGERRSVVGVERHIGSEGLGRRGEQPVVALVMDFEVVIIPENEVAAAVTVVVHLVDATLLPGIVSVAVGLDGLAGYPHR